MDIHLQLTGNTLYSQHVSTDSVIEFKHNQPQQDTCSSRVFTINIIIKLFQNSSSLAHVNPATALKEENQSKDCWMLLKIISRLHGSLQTFKPSGSLPRVCCQLLYMLRISLYQDQQGGRTKAPLGESIQEQNQIQLNLRSICSSWYTGRLFSETLAGDDKVCHWLSPSMASLKKKTLIKTVSLT